MTKRAQSISVSNNFQNEGVSSPKRYRGVSQIHMDTCIFYLVPCSFSCILDMFDLYKKDPHIQPLYQLLSLCMQ